MSDLERNAAQIDYWNGEVGTRWVSLQDRIDALFSELTRITLDHAGPRAGETILDVGCGCGGTVLALASRVGAAGRVLGVDISRVMLDVAQRRIQAGGHANAEVILADAAVHAFEPRSTDLVFSRFGVMFFDQPRRAFANLREALRPGGRLAFVCWRPFAENPWFAAPYWAAKPHLDVPEQPKADPAAPGPFSLDDPVRVETMLTGAGFSAIEITPRDVLFQLAPSGALEEATSFIVQIGPVSRLLAHAPPDRCETAKAAVRSAIAAFDGPDGIRVPARVWVASARA